MIEIKTNNSNEYVFNNENKTQTRSIIEKAFFGKNNCLKIIFNTNKDCYFQFGIQKNDSWDWKNVKFSDIELGKLSNFIKKCNSGIKEVPSISFYHTYKNKSTQIWVNKYNDNIIIKTNDISKSLSEGEQIVLNILIERIIIQKSIV